MNFQSDSDSFEGLTKSWILSRITEEEILQYYLRVTIQFNHRFRSPLRKDLNPTCSFSKKGNRVRFRDWSLPHSMDCFDVVQRIYNCSYGDALSIIARDFALKSKPIKYNPVISSLALGKENPQIRKHVDLKGQVRKFNSYDGKFLSTFGITLEICRKYKVFPLQRIWKEGKCIWTHSLSDPALGYYFGIDQDGLQQWKVYFWRRIQNRFIQNTNCIQGLKQLPEKGDLLVITKSLKDVMSLDRMKISSIALQSESVIINEDVIADFVLRFSKLIILYDFDYTGIVGAARIRRTYNIPARFLTNGRFKTHNYNAKDVSDLVRLMGVDEATRLIYDLLK